MNQTQEQHYYLSQHEHSRSESKYKTAHPHKYKINSDSSSGIIAHTNSYGSEQTSNLKYSTLAWTVTHHVTGL